MLNRFHAALAAVAFTAVAQVASPLHAQDYPTRPVQIIVPQPPGGGTDIITRIFADQLTKQLGQTFVVENRAGAGTVVGSVAAARPRRTATRCSPASPPTWR